MGDLLLSHYQKHLVFSIGARQLRRRRIELVEMSEIIIEIDDRFWNNPKGVT
jgi:hypothetical protein